MRTTTRLAGCIALLVGISGSSAAQRVVRGSVLDSASDVPVAGAVVTLLGASGASLGRTVSGAAGDFSISVPASEAVARARVLRIGFRPRDLDIARAASAGESIRVRMSRLPSLLDAVHVTGRELCPSSTDRGGAFTLWEQVHAGLLATVVAREANPATAVVLTYERHESPSDHLVQQQSRSVRSGTTTRPFVAAASAQQFAAAGYVVNEESGRRLYAPDADVLLDESFAATHCFRLENADAAHKGQIGLAFTPARQRAGTVDVTGVIWVDAAQPALRSLDFRHTGFDSAWARNPPGGHIEFHSAPNGVSFIERWAIDIPMVKVHPGAPGSFAVGRVVSSQPDQVVVEAVYVAGGSVLSTHWRDGSSWSDAPTGISGVVTEDATTRPVAGAVVSVEGTADSVTTDSEGRFSITPMVPGRYMVRVADTTLQAFARSRAETHVVEVERNHVADLRAHLSGIDATIGQVCKDKGSVFKSVLVGHLDRDGTNADNGQVRASWRVNLGGQAMDLSREGAVDEHGRFLVCGLPSNVEVYLHWSADAGQADTVVAIGPGSVGQIEWRLPARRKP